MTDNPFYKKADELTDLMNRLDFAGKSDLADDVMQSINDMLERGNKLEERIRELEEEDKK
jgi:hypothetical protein